MEELRSTWISRPVTLSLGPSSRRLGGFLSDAPHASTRHRFPTRCLRDEQMTTSGHSMAIGHDLPDAAPDRGIDIR